MAGLVPAIHIFEPAEKDVDARNKSAHDEFGLFTSSYELGFACVHPVGWRPMKKALFGSWVGLSFASARPRRNVDMARSETFIVG